MAGRTTIPAVILAGGQATRMGGGDKGLLPLQGGVLLDQVIARLTPQCGPLALNANGDPARFRRFRLPVLPDGIPGQPGPLAGVLAAMDWAADLGADRVATVAADTPFFPRDLIVRLGALPGLVLAASAGPDHGQQLHPTFGLWPVALRSPLRDSLDRSERKVRLWAEQHGATAVVFQHGGADPFFNVNTPMDLRQAQALARGGQCFWMK